ncbi:uncharacterized protein si:ch211-67e16.4 [Oncorhynchus keta]|uniref:uncharacterized protein si:ch211-67e16.4 n=1 Tax=Oncorhynchus keta TaxID=8018 RepID=UPI0015FBC0A4|nr:uncharacterized protein si:ch211-67e16.4 [Oncorhynchus keta]XP_052379127.1 uncharacterized protein si:ch211-67e16.4 [Oncorhynchus keta]XP_052379128.1 uncharacterized protein si:ch211-67e16.4 [Oncorhynchus keta]XP_052379129.1 uncharacterized protein si:ch211-67e16.4 [Oncorhynchus keta]XP_052379130.1 uncharacterized protein si:ch211-67e16.4 [Oncorhynchus keta]XP_052379131.1 uncharacterized protein si:ch211-67e16.4 [Oncorhynchus keta]XP_052379132.1 uncharacterized protein si:ch211-67e16.4 [On
MDISLTVSLMQGQMGTVIERAVSAAVETVLGEMLKVVGIKFDELKREVAAKEKETESIRQMLDISRSQMKTMRKYMNALGARQQEHSATYQTNQSTAFGHSDPQRPHCSSAAASEAAQSSGLSQPQRRTVTNTHVAITNGNVQSRNQITIALPSDNLARSSQPSSFDSHDDLTATVSQALESPSLITPVSAINSSSEHLKEEPPAPLDPEVSDEGQRREEEEECQAEWTIITQPPETSTDPGDQLVLSPPGTDGADCFATMAAGSAQPQLQVKEEEAEVEIICIKQEPEDVESLLFNLAAEVLNSQGNLLDRHTQGSLLDCPRTVPSQGQRERTVPSQGQRERTASLSSQSQRTLTEHTVFSSASPCTYGLSQPVMSMARGVAPRPMVRPWPKDLSLYEEFKMRRTELRRRSQTRRREMEKNLPQPLLADLVKERREKTRLRVARWRAKRKLQACQLTQMSQTQHQAGPGLGQGNSGLANHSPISQHTQHKTTGPTQTPQRNRVALSQSQYNNSFLYNRSHCETGAGNVNYPPHQFNSSSLMLGQHGGHNMVEPVMISSSQQGLSLTDSELYQ